MARLRCRRIVLFVYEIDAERKRDSEREMYIRTWIPDR